ncbi:MAG: hypothetical protein EBR09_02565 [Proteobacteria bacterium]|nr:hypothetical protein [Pseudomonadota bacterium]
MKKLSPVSCSSQNGSALTTALVFASGAVIATAALTSLTKSLRKSNEQKETVNSERRLNESAITNVSQLINNGQLHFNKDCQRVEPTQPNADYRFAGCGDVAQSRGKIDCDGNEAASKWLYSWDAGKKVASVDVCASEQLKPSAGGGIKNYPVRVTLRSYEAEKAEDGGERNFAAVRSQIIAKPDEKRKYSSLSGKLSLGLASGNKGLVGRHGAADTCFYMRPSTAVQSRGGGTNLAFRARKGTDAYAFNELEPRPDGPNADEFRHEVNLAFPDPIEKDYAVLNDFRAKQIFPLYAQGLRGNRPSSLNWNLAYAPYTADVLSKNKITDVQRLGFVGVMPNVPNGPKFKYFLWAKMENGSAVHSQSFTRFDARQEKGFETGCSTTTGRAGGNPKFCTKVEMPLYKYAATLRKRCVESVQTLEPVPATQAPKVVNADRSILTSCDPEWIKRVEIVARQTNRYNEGLLSIKNQDATNFSGELTIEMALSALEADDDFLNGKGIWAQEEKSNSAAYRQLKVAYNSFSSRFRQAGQVAVNKFTVSHTSDVCAGPTCTLDEMRSKTRSFKVWSIQNEQTPQQVAHTSNTCAYFRYHAPESAKGCKIDFVTKEENNWVCRNNDGCFDELTKVRMADGSDRVMTQLRKGDLVHNPVTGKPAKIVKLTIGPEEKALYQVTVGGLMVRVTDSHPFMTRRGWVTAKYLTLSDAVLSAGRKFLPVDKITLGERGRTVVNLALEGPANSADLHYVLADGVVTGDLVIQNMISLQAFSQQGGR